MAGKKRQSDTGVKRGHLQAGIRLDPPQRRMHGLQLRSRRGGAAEDELDARAVVIDARQILVELRLIFFANREILGAGDEPNDPIRRLTIAP